MPEFWDIDGARVTTVPSFWSGDNRMEALLQEKIGHIFVGQDEDDRTKIIFKFVTIDDGPEECIVLLFHLTKEQAGHLEAKFHEAAATVIEFVKDREDTLRSEMRNYLDDSTTPNLLKVKGALTEVEAVRYGS